MHSTPTVVCQVCSAYTAMNRTDLIQWRDRPKVNHTPWKMYNFTVQGREDNNTLGCSSGRAPLRKDTEAEI